MKFWIVMFAIVATMAGVAFMAGRVDGQAQIDQATRADKERIICNTPGVKPAICAAKQGGL